MNAVPEEAKGGLTYLESANHGGLAKFYMDSLMNEVLPFWLNHGLDKEHGGIFNCLDNAGAVIDTDKDLLAQARAGYLFATLYNEVDKRPEWLEAARSCVEFSL